MSPQRARALPLVIGALLALPVMTLAAPPRATPPAPLGAVGVAGAASMIRVAAQAPPRVIGWDDLLPENERDNFTSQPMAPSHDYLGEAGPAAPQVLEFDVNKALDGVEVKIPGFVVPLDLADGKVSEFFIVPYFGACIHVPPPPPNQLVYVKLPRPIPIEQTYNALLITGRLQVSTRSTRLAASAYSLRLDKIEPYRR